MIEYTILNELIIKLKVYCSSDRFYGQSKFRQYDKENNWAPWPLSTIHTYVVKIRGWIKKFWNYSHISLNIGRNYIKLKPSTNSSFPNFAIMFDRRSSHANMWRHHLTTSYNNQPAKKNCRTIFFPKKEQSPIFMDHLAINISRLKPIWHAFTWTWTNNFLNMQFLIF